MKNLNITLKELVNILNKESKKLVGAKFDDRYLSKNISGKHRLVCGIINEILKQKGLDNVMSGSSWNIKIKHGIITPYGVKLLTANELELIKYSFKIKEDKRIKHGSAGIIEDIRFVLIDGIDEKLTLNEMLYDLSIKEIQEWINFNERKILKLKKDLKEAEEEREYYINKLNELSVDK